MKFARHMPFNEFGVMHRSILDVFVTADLAPAEGENQIPAGVSDPQGWFRTMFAPISEAWDYYDEWFREVPLGVKPGAMFMGAVDGPLNETEVADPTKYKNTDGTDATGGAYSAPP